MTTSGAVLVIDDELHSRELLASAAMTALLITG